MNQTHRDRIAFRRAESADVPVLAELLCLGAGGVVDAVYDGIPGAGAPKALIERRFTLANSINHFHNSTVAVRNGAVVGQLISYPMDDALDEAPDPVIPPDRLIYWEPLKALRVPGSYYIASLAVLPGQQNRGIGSSLLSIARSRAKEKGLREISLQVFEENHRAVALYRRKGFKIVGHRPVIPHRLIRYGGNFIAMTAPA